jgi:hypothetical protein
MGKDAPPVLDRAFALLARLTGQQAEVGKSGQGGGGCVVSKRFLAGFRTSGGGRKKWCLSHRPP